MFLWGCLLFFLGFWVRRDEIRGPLLLVGIILMAATQTVPPLFSAHDPSSPLTVTVENSPIVVAIGQNNNPVLFTLTNHSNRAIALPNGFVPSGAKFYCSALGTEGPDILSGYSGQLDLRNLLKPGESITQQSFVDRYIRFYLPGRYYVNYQCKLFWRYDAGTRAPPGSDTRPTDRVEWAGGDGIVDAYAGDVETSPPAWIWNIFYVLLLPVVLLIAIYGKHLRKLRLY